MTENASLKSLHTALIDARKGYETAGDKAETPEIRAIFQKMIAMHRQSHTEIGGILARRGETADESGSFMAAVHKTAISVRSAITGLDEGSLASFAGGEERIAGEYDKAIGDNAGDASAARTLKRQRRRLADAIAEMTSLAA